MSEWKFRLAEPADAADFSKWAAENTQVDPKDLWAGTKKKNPTVIFYAVEKDGVVVAFAPVYLQLTVAHLGFNPAAEGKDKLRALQMLTDGVSAIGVQYGIREITTLSKEDYPVAQWAIKHGFELEPRQLLKLDMNKVLEVAEAENLCAPVAAK
jgi:hypothetical protein